MRRRRYRGEPALVCEDPTCERRRWLRVRTPVLLILLWSVLMGAGLLLAGCGPKEDKKEPSTEVTCEPSRDGQLQICWNVKVHA